MLIVNYYVVRSVTRQCAFFLRSHSQFGYNFFSCCQRFQIVVSIPDFHNNLNFDSSLRRIRTRCHIPSVSVDNIRLITELILLRDNILDLSKSV